MPRGIDRERPVRLDMPVSEIAERITKRRDLAKIMPPVPRPKRYEPLNVQALKYAQRHASDLAELREMFGWAKMGAQIYVEEEERGEIPEVAEERVLEKLVGHLPIERDFKGYSRQEIETLESYIQHIFQYIFLPGRTHPGVKTLIKFFKEYRALYLLPELSPEEMASSLYRVGEARAERLKRIDPEYPEYGGNRP